MLRMWHADETAGSTAGMALRRVIRPDWLAAPGTDRNCQALAGIADDQLSDLSDVGRAARQAARRRLGTRHPAASLVEVLKLLRHAFMEARAMEREANRRHPGFE